MSCFYYVSPAPACGLHVLTSCSTINRSCLDEAVFKKPGAIAPVSMELTSC